eukprot:TRINITY_DN83309_c0_g1_i1.p1 TRINITY_DN83309_c0_g1~~TRINITY_DN83309_c0_g1_i1.p1  ORF type:complete len:134 (+),score=8.35 TRINITY_DN83309_c0_g1_i1:21-422(+)
MSHIRSDSQYSQCSSIVQRQKAAYEQLNNSKNVLPPPSPLSTPTHSRPPSPSASQKLMPQDSQYLDYPAQTPGQFYYENASLSVHDLEEQLSLGSDPLIDLKGNTLLGKDDFTIDKPHITVRNLTLNIHIFIF